jgi:7,8-dihydropterin-6-yl-methyl-4-(beta-D-ribofuranosyl)aminobenzene 5'-phosphate synthase
MQRLLMSMLLAIAATLLPATAAEPAQAPAKSVKVTILSTMLADAGIGEWGFAALVEVDGRKILFDTGARPDTVLKNAEELKIDLSQVTDVILSHNHDDHTGGLLALRAALKARNPQALSRAHVAEGIFLPRHEPGSQAEANPMLAARAAYEAGGGAFAVHRMAERIAPGVWLTGPVKRRYPEHNWFDDTTIAAAGGDVVDNVPEDMSLVIEGPDGLIVVTGCGHAGIGNILAQAREMVPGVPVTVLAGGLHLLSADEDKLAWTAQQIKAAGVRYLLAAHCTGLEATYRLRALLGLNRKTAVVAAVGSSYSTISGIDPLLIAK